MQSSTDAIVTLDGAGVVRGWNPAAERLLGYTRREARGRDLEFLAPETDGWAVREALLHRCVEGVRRQ